MSKQERRCLYKFGPYRLLPQERLLLRDGEPVALTQKAFDTLAALVERAGRLVEKDKLLNEVWAGTSVEESNIAQNVFALRRVLGKSEDGGQYIETVPKRGYRFLASVSVSEDRGGELFTRQHASAQAPQNRQATTTDTLMLPHASGDTADESSAESYDGAPAAALLSAPASNGERGAAVTLPQPTTVTPPRTTTAEAAPQLVPRRWRKVGLLVVSLALASALVGLGVVIASLFLAPPPQSPPSAITLNRLMSGRRIWSAAVSPDGRHVAHVVENAGQTSIWVR